MTTSPRQPPAPARLRYALFDLDNTLYPADNGLWGAISERINLYMIQRLQMPPAEAGALRRRYLHAFGNTLSGLRQDFGIDGVEYLNFVHDLPLERYLRPDPALDAMLARLPQEKVIFTNADTPHARRVLGHLGLSQHFTRIVDIVALNFVNKPEPRAYQRALELLGAAPGECVFVEDTAHNLPPAHDLGMCTVLVDNHPAERAPAHPAAPGIDYSIADILELEDILAAAPCRSDALSAG